MTGADQEDRGTDNSKEMAAKGAADRSSHLELQEELAASQDVLEGSSLEAEILREIETAELTHMTPFEALNRLVEWQARLRKEK